MRTIALTLCLTLSACATSASNARFYAKLGEGGAIVAGALVLAFTKTPADCDGQVGTMPGLDTDNDSCRQHARDAEAIGVTLILAGILGFIATVSTSPDARPAPTTVTLPPVGTAPTPAPTSPIPLPAPTPTPSPAT